jgi:hypothetical protein
MTKVMIWAPTPIQELNFVTGFVQCDPALAKSLISAGKAQDPRKGALAMRPVIKTDRALKAPKPAPEPEPVEAETPKTYNTREIVAKKSRGQ